MRHAPSRGWLVGSHRRAINHYRVAGLTREPGCLGGKRLA